MVAKQPTKPVRVGPYEIGPGRPLLIISGPCQIESLDHALKHAEHLAGLCRERGFSFVYKSSFDKANRTSIQGQRGPGLDAGLRVLEEIKKQIGVPVLTDVHTPEQIPTVAAVVDAIQTPAFLCRQTDLLLAAGKSGKPVNVKKGQFLHPSDMQYAAEKISSTGNSNVLLCERGTCFGYRDLVVDMRSLIVMRELGYPVIFDATHSVQQMGGAGGASSGARTHVAALAKGAVAVGVDGIFLECHEDPDHAPSDGPCMIPLREAATLLDTVRRVREAVG